MALHGVPGLLFLGPVSTFNLFSQASPCPCLLLRPRLTALHLKKYKTQAKSPTLSPKEAFHSHRLCCYLWGQRWKNMVQFSSVAKSCPTLSDPMNHSTPGLPVHHKLPESTQTHVHWAGDAIQPSHPLSSPSDVRIIPFSSHLQSFPASGSLPMSQFFTLGGQSIGVSASASVLSVNIQDWFPLGWTSLISLLSKGLSRVFSNTTVQMHQFYGAQLSL